MEMTPNTPAQDKLTQTERDEKAKSFEAFKKAYADVPSQDNEGWVPERGSYKAGFFAGEKYGREEARNDLMPKITTLFSERDSLSISCERQHEEITALKASLQTAVAALEFVSRNDFDNFQDPYKVARIAMSISAKNALAKIRKVGGV